MAKAKRVKNKDNARRSKKKTSILTTDHVTYVDYKDVNLLRKFMSERAKVRARRVTGNNAQQQREVARAIKNAREMALLPYANRVTQQRGGRGRDRDRDDSELSSADAGVTERDQRRTRSAAGAPDAGDNLDTTEAIEAGDNLDTTDAVEVVEGAEDAGGASSEAEVLEEVES